VKRVLWILLCDFFVVCLISGLVFAVDPSEEKPEIPTKEKSANMKEVSLYQYYQTHLLPYLTGPKSKTKGKYAESENKGGTPSSASLLLNRKKTDEAGVSPNGSPTEQKSKGEDGQETTFITLHKGESIGLAEINKSFPREVLKEYKAEVLLGYKVSPLVEILFGKVQKIESSQYSPWGIHDDGWRLKLKKDF
jgi:hypothetical protein